MEAIEVFEGIMLGDAGLSLHSGGARLDMGLSGKKMSIPNEKLLGYLSFVAERLTALKATVSTGYPKVSGTKCRLLTLTSSFLTEQYGRWYPNKGSSHRKEVPEDFVLTTVSLSHWFMGDGSSSPDSRSRTINVKLCSEGYTKSSVELLEHQLHILGVAYTGRRYSHVVQCGAGIGITILQKSVNTFMDIISPYMIEPYGYKVRRRVEVGQP